MLINENSLVSFSPTVALIVTVPSPSAETRPSSLIETIFGSLDLNSILEYLSPIYSSSFVNWNESPTARYFLVLPISNFIIPSISNFSLYLVFKFPLYFSVIS